MLAREPGNPQGAAIQPCTAFVTQSATHPQGPVQTLLGRAAPAVPRSRQARLARLRPERDWTRMSMRYSDTHEWIRPAAEGRSALGISAFASQEIGEVAHVALPTVGDRLQAGAVCCE
ncbi:MAG: hypothetical protein ACOCXA_06355, partial [Planctomycetota bacterium]